MEPEERRKHEAAILAAHDPIRQKVRERPPSWRDLIQSTGFHEWLQIMAGRATSAIAFRIRQLREQNRSLDVHTLDGERIRSDEWAEYELHHREYLERDAYLATCAPEFC